jgi:hypothetical protein
MAAKVTLKKVEQEIEQLSAEEQIKLIAYISQRLSELKLSQIDHGRREHAVRIKKFLKMSDEMAARASGNVDSAEGIRQMREERISKL